MKPTGNYHKPLANWLLTNEYEIVYVGGTAIKENRKLLDGRWDKNDTKDSGNLADLINQGKCQFYGYPENDFNSLSSLLTLRKRLKGDSFDINRMMRDMKQVYSVR